MATKKRKRTSSLNYYLVYRTPGGQRKCKGLGKGAAAAAALGAWRKRVRGKGYRTIKIMKARSMASVKRLLKAAPKKRHTTKRRTTKRRTTKRRVPRRRTSKRRTAKRRISRRKRRTSRRGR